MNRFFFILFFVGYMRSLQEYIQARNTKYTLRYYNFAKMYGTLDILAALKILLESVTEANINNITAFLDNRPQIIYSLDINNRFLENMINYMVLKQVRRYNKTDNK